jgi:ATP-dependent Lhr-like helicase
VLEAITARGALFFYELQTHTGLLPSQLEDSLGELIAQGKVTADGYGAIRYFASRGKGKGRKRRIALAQPLSHRERGRRIAGRAGQRSPASSGRWSLFPGTIPPVPHEERLERWAWQLLQRWGVLFRDLMVRETLSPRWSQLLPMLRRMEARGEIRGGRFVAGVAGEQYALPESIEALRRIRDEPLTGDVLVLSAADPLNLAGLIAGEPRVALKHTATIALRDGRLLASQQSGEVQFYDEASAELIADLSRRLRRFDVAVSEQDLALQR